MVAIDQIKMKHGCENTAVVIPELKITVDTHYLKAVMMKNEIETAVTPDFYLQAGNNRPMGISHSRMVKPRIMK